MTLSDFLSVVSPLAQSHPVEAFGVVTLAVIAFATYLTKD